MVCRPVVAARSRAHVSPLRNPAVAEWLRRGFVLEQRTIKVGVKPIQVFRAGGRLSRLGITLQPLVKAEQQQGLRFLPQLSQPAGALVAVNGGFFNRINQLPLGAVRHQGVWLSGPILNRGVIAWGILRGSAVRPAASESDAAGEQRSPLEPYGTQQRLRSEGVEPLHTCSGGPATGP